MKAAEEIYEEIEQIAPELDSSDKLALMSYVANTQMDAYIEGTETAMKILGEKNETE